ncbi:MAG: hypothetical protein HY671_01805 [Chloroflexi bacterium]|nr:hypothetical protein [Chloroflexota bacterium]
MPVSLTFDSDEATYLDKISKFYEITKELLIFGEQIDPENNTLSQTINELRNCLDHLMRVVSFKFGNREMAEGANYARTNLDKAYGHVYRAAYDTLDWVSLNLKDRMISELNGFTIETIQAVIPEYFTDIKPKLDRILNEEVTKLRSEKDIAASSEDNFIKYVKVTAELKQLVQAVIDKKPALVEHRTRLGRSNRRKLVGRILENIAVAAAAGLLVWALTR